MNEKLQWIEEWFKKQNWTPQPFQREAWKLILSGADGLISVPTGAGKTYAVYLAALANAFFSKKKGLLILYITPLKALARDLEHSLMKPITDLNLSLKVEKRTGDSTSSQRMKQAKKPPEVLLTTPESLSLLLSSPNAQELFKDLQTVIIDEWHELLGSKRGVLLELSLARLKHQNASLNIWGLTATIGNLEEAAQVCVGMDRKPSIVAATIPREMILETLLPPSFEQLPWSGQLGMRRVTEVLNHLSLDYSTLIFTNTRSQAERWFQALAEAKPEWKNLMALHHSSIDKKERQEIEEKIKQGELKLIVCTSSLDLGVDFSPVEHVFQIGSPKSIARLLQRAGRSSHRPLTPCRLTIVPTHTLELIEIQAYRKALQQHRVEKRIPLKKCYDVLLQHLTTCAIGGGFSKEDMFQQLQSTHAFQELTLEEFDQTLHFLRAGGNALNAYPEYQKLQLENQVYYIDNKKIIQFHRMNIGTITSIPQVIVKMAQGKTLGVIEENFISSLKPGDHFLFGGRRLKLIQFRDLIAYVRLGKEESKTTAIWQGARLPFSHSLGLFLRETLTQPQTQSTEHFPETPFIQHLLSLQDHLSHVPQMHELLIERLKTREGWHLFIYPFEGKFIHEGLAYLIADRLSRNNKITFKLSSNDYGFELLSHEPIDDSLLQAALFSSENLEEEISSVVNLHELSRSFFKDIARIGGLVFQGYPGKHKTHRQIQISSSLLYEVLKKYDPDNLLLKEAYHETMYQHFDLIHLKEVLDRLKASALSIVPLKKFSPFSLPLFIERMSGHLTTESIAERIEKIKKSWTK